MRVSYQYASYYISGSDETLCCTGEGRMIFQIFCLIILRVSERRHSWQRSVKMQRADVFTDPARAMSSFHTSFYLSDHLIMSVLPSIHRYYFTYKAPTLVKQLGQHINTCSSENSFSYYTYVQQGWDRFFHSFWY